MSSLLKALTKPNLEVHNFVGGGTNTLSAPGVVVEEWRPWDEFNYKTLTQIFSAELAQDYSGSPEPKSLGHDKYIFNEATFDDIARRFMSPVINYALAKQQRPCHYGRGTRYPTYLEPDWSVISEYHRMDNGTYINILPGDTKLSAKWKPSMVYGTEGEYDEWQKVMNQIANYMAINRCRYGFILTDENLVVLRVALEHVGATMAAERPRRVAARTHFTDVSEMSDISVMSSGTADSSFRDDDPMKWRYNPPEYAVIPWNASGQGQLTVKLALWCLAMMAANGDRYLDYSYPDLDTWRRADKGWVHNTSGARLTKLGRNDRQQEPNPDGESAESSGPSTSSAAQTHYNYSYGEGYDDAAEDAPQYSRASSTYGDDRYQQAQLAAGDAYYEEDDGDDTETEASGRSKRHSVEIKKHTLSSGIYFVDSKGKKRETSKKMWKKVDGGYELQSGRHIYFTKRFP